MKYILFSLVLFISFSSQAQKLIGEGRTWRKIRIHIKNDSAQFVDNGFWLYPLYKIKSHRHPWVCIAMKKGYVNYGFTYAEADKKNERDERGRKVYTIELEKVQQLPAGYSSKMIDVYNISDKTGKITEFDYADPFFKTELAHKLIAYGYQADVFNDKKKEVQLTIVGEIVTYSRNTFGHQFQISVIVNWSVYDVSKQQVVLQCRSTGYSDTVSRFKNELGYALRNALVGLMSNREFQELAKDKGGN